jgi:hypothetical protein
MKTSATGNIYKIARTNNLPAHPWQITCGDTLLSSHKSQGEARKQVRDYYRGDEAYMNGLLRGNFS